MSADQTIRYGPVRDGLRTDLALRAPDLRATATDDIALAMLDTWACLAEIIGFAQGRLHEESVIDLATDATSVAEITRVLGYQVDPGVAATAPLAFVVDDSPGAHPMVPVPRGTAAMSNPPPGHPSVTYETLTDIEARPAWNALRPRRTRHPQLTTDSTSLTLAGTDQPVAAGDGLLVPVGSDWVFGVVQSVTVRPGDPPVPGTDPLPGHTQVRYRPLPGAKVLPTGMPAAPGSAAGASSPDRDAIRAETAARGVDGVLLSAADLRRLADRLGRSESDLLAALRDGRPAPPAAIVLRARTGIHGANAAPWATLPADTQRAYRAANGGYDPPWADGTLETYPGAIITSGLRSVTCDRVVDTATATLVVLRDGQNWGAYHCSAATPVTRSAFGVTGRGTALTLTAASLAAFGIRSATCYLDPHWAPLADEPNPTPITVGITGTMGNSGTPSTGSGHPALTLADWVPGLRDGQLVWIRGAAVASPSRIVSHVTTAVKVHHDVSPTGATRLELADPLPEPLLRDTVVVNGNVAPASHGRGRVEVLGNADGRDLLPRFVLAAGPLTYLNGADGSRPELTVWVGGVEQPRLPVALGDGLPGYAVRRLPDGRTAIEFDAPLPTGVTNVRAAYRVGVGTAAQVPAHALTLLANPPAGVRSVTNPLPAQGGADPEGADDARWSAPASTRALGRLVSLQDYEDFAACYPGVAQAKAVWSIHAGRRGVHLSVAGQRGMPVGDTGPVRDGLLAAFAAAGDPTVPITLAGHRGVPVVASVAVRMEPGRVADDVVAAARQAVLDRFGPGRMRLGQPLALSDLVATVQRADGVAAAHLLALHRATDQTGQTQPSEQTQSADVIRAQAPAAGILVDPADREGTGTAQGAELLHIDPDTLTVEVTT